MPFLMRSLVFIACVFMTVSAGCAVRELHDDQNKIRSALLDLYTDQIIDNLIRASNGMPIIQIDYTNATAQVTVGQTEGLSDSPVRTKTNALTLAAMSSYAITRTSMNTLMGNLSGSNSNQVAVTATPVTTSNEVYDAYLAFLTLPGSLQLSCDVPPPGVAHIYKKCGSKYYWVPTEFKREFLGLALATTAQRGKPIPAPDAYEVSLKGVIGNPIRDDKDLFILTVLVDKKIPNDSGRVLFGDGSAVLIGPYIPDAGPAPAETDKLKLYLDLTKAPVGAKTVDEFKAKLPLSAKVYVRGRRPEPPTTNDLLNRVNFQLQQIQFNQLRSGGP
jgi:hypothetical protein